MPALGAEAGVGVVRAGDGVGAGADARPDVS